MIFFKCRYLRHFCGATSGFSQHCHESGASLRKSGVFYRAAGDPGWPTSQHYRKSGVFCPKSDAFYRVAGDPWGPIQGKGTGLDTNAHLAGKDYPFPCTTFRRARPVGTRGSPGTARDNPARWLICPDGHFAPDCQSGQMANLPRCPTRPDGQPAQMTNPARWLICPDWQSAQMANLPRWPICPHG